MNAALAGSLIPKQAFTISPVRPLLDLDPSRPRADAARRLDQPRRRPGCVTCSTPRPAGDETRSSSPSRVWPPAFSTRAGSFKAVDGVSFDVRRGEVVGLVGGKSGSGKSVTGYSIPGPGRAAGPDRRRAGRCCSRARNLLALSPDKLRRMRRGARRHGLSKDPMMTLNPVLKIGTPDGRRRARPPRPRSRRPRRSPAPARRWARG